MKKYHNILTLLFLFCFSFSAAQTEKGSLLLGGSASMNFNIEPASSFSLRVNPSLGIFVVDRLAIGLDLSSGLTFGNNFQQYNLGFIPNVKYYFGISDNFDVFIGGGFGPSVFITDRNGRDVNTTTTFTIFTGPALVFFLNEHTAVHLGLTYNGFLGGDNFNDSHATFLSAGFQIYLPR